MANFLIQMASLRNSPPLRQVAGTFNRLIFAGQFIIKVSPAGSFLGVFMAPTVPWKLCGLQADGLLVQEDHDWVEHEMLTSSLFPANHKGCVAWCERLQKEVPRALTHLTVYFLPSLNRRWTYKWKGKIKRTRSSG